MKKRRVTAVLLSASLLAGVLTGCSVQGKSELLTPAKGVISCEDKSSETVQGSESGVGSVTVTDGGLEAKPVVSIIGTDSRGRLFLQYVKGKSE